MKKYIQYRILERALNKFGHDMQVYMLFEEFSELIKAIIKFRKSGRFNSMLRDELFEEIADAKIMIAQLQHIYECKGVVNGHIRYKLQKLKHKINLKEEYALEGEDGEE